MASTVGLEIRHPGHGPVVIHHLTDDPGRDEPGQTGQIDGCLGLASSLQHATGLCLERKDVTRLHEVGRMGDRVDGHLDGAGAVGGRDAGGDAFPCLDRDREGGFKAGLVLGRHQVKTQFVAALRTEGKTDEPSTLLGHEG